MQKLKNNEARPKFTGSYKKKACISTPDTVEFEENNGILIRKVNFAFMITNPSLDCSYVVLNFWPNLSFVVRRKLFL